jgi:MoaA/NifB/PqqE/SkfB family radical SAM enzyme
VFLDSVDSIHIEPTTACNAACPSCLRNFYSQDLPADRFVLTEFQIDWLKHLNWGDPKRIMLQGNYGDIIMHSDPLGFCAAARAQWPDAEVILYTNGAALHQDFWRDVARLGCSVEFGIDGLDQETHVRYRRNTRLDRVLQNAQAFIEAGGVATWAFTEFAHNKHQTSQVAAAAASMGFQYYVIRPSLREPLTPVLNKQFQVVDLIASTALDLSNFDFDHYSKTTSRKFQIQIAREGVPARVETEVKVVPDCSVVCDSVQIRTIYVDAQGSVMPCNYFGDPVKWANICNHYGVDVADYSVQNHWLDQIMQKPFWDRLLDSIARGETINTCVNFCSKKTGVDMHWMHGVKSRRPV